MRMPLLSYSVLLLVLAGCAVRTPAPGASDVLPPSIHGKHLQHTLVDVRAQRAIAFNTLVDAVAKTDVVAIGEEHHQPDIQAFALRLLEALAQRRPRHLALAMEFLERDQQILVDAYLTGAIDRPTLQNRLGVSQAFMRDYFPLLDYARRQGLPVIAMNIPRRIARQVAREGLQNTLQQLSHSEREHLPDAFSAIAPLYRTYFLEAVAPHHALQGEAAEYFVQASHLKDDTMAEALARFLDAHPGVTILALAGRFHFDYGKAIPALLQQRRQHTIMPRITAMTVANDSVIDLQRLARDTIADYLWFSPPASDAPPRLETRMAMPALRESQPDRCSQHQRESGTERNNVCLPAGDGRPLHVSTNTEVSVRPYAD